MKMVFLKFFFSGLLVLGIFVWGINNFKQNFVYSRVCDSCSNSNCCGEACTGDLTCQGGAVSGCGCSSPPAPTPVPFTPIPTIPGQPTATPGGPTPTPGPTAVPSCTADCSGTVCGDTGVACPCAGGYDCINGTCQKCTSPGVACCGYCVPQGWGCGGNDCKWVKTCTKETCQDFNNSICGGGDTVGVACESGCGSANTCNTATCSVTASACELECPANCGQACDPFPASGINPCRSGASCVNIPGRGNVCVNPICPSSGSCTCDPYTIQGRKVSTNPAYQTLFSSQTITVTGQGNTTNNPYSFPSLPGYAGYQVTANVPLGASVGYTLCYNDINCHLTTPTPGNSVTTSPNRASSENYDASDPYHYVDLYWHYTLLTPNCRNLTGPSTILKGDTVAYSSTYENSGGPVTNRGLAIHDSACTADVSNQTSSGGPGTISFNWTTTAVGSYVADCRAWNDGVAECRGDCVDGPPRYTCAGPDAKKTITVINPPPWYKLKNASLTKLGDIFASAVQNVKKFTDIDTDDDSTKRYIIFGNAGAGITTGVYDQFFYASLPISDKGWIGTSYSYSPTFYQSFYSYALSRKLIKNISSLAEVETNKINVIRNDSANITINDDVLSARAPFVLIFRNTTDTDYGNLTINYDKFNNSSASVAFIAKTITFGDGVTYSNGIFIGDNFVIPATSHGLKIKGNLISNQAINLINQGHDNTRPYLFVVFDPNMYLGLLPYLSIANYDWQQLQ